MIKIVPYSDELKMSLFEFTDRCFDKLGKRFEPEGRHGFYNDIGHEFVMFDCLLQDGSVAGSVALKKLDDKTVELKALYLDESLRGQGFGSELMKRAVGYAGDAGFEAIVLDSMSQYKEALRLYERFGFKPCARYNDNPYADVFMKKDLDER